MTVIKIFSARAAFTVALYTFSIISFPCVSPRIMPSQAGMLKPDNIAELPQLRTINRYPKGNRLSSANTLSCFMHVRVTCRSIKLCLKRAKKNEGLNFQLEILLIVVLACKFARYKVSHKMVRYLCIQLRLCLRSFNSRYRAPSQLLRCLSIEIATRITPLFSRKCRIAPGKYARFVL